MSVSVYSIAMALGCFTLAAAVGAALLRRTSRGGVILVGVVFALAGVRVLLPLDFDDSFVIESRVWYPAVQDWCRSPLLGGLTGGQVLLLVWLAGSVLSFALLIRRILGLLRFRRRAEAVGPHLQELARQAAGELDYAGPIRLAVAESAGTPYQCGYFIPYILLPGNVGAFTDDEILNMLRHELCHWLGRDMWLKTGLMGARCLLWWNPVMGPLERSVEHMLELRCDRRVCGALPEGQAVAYLGTLLHLIEADQGRRKALSMGYVGITEEEAILHRFRIILADSRPGISKRILAGIILIVALFTGSYAVIVQPHGGTPDYSTEYYEPDFGNTYVLYSADAEYVYYEDGQPVRVLSEEELNEEPYCSLPLNYEVTQEGETEPYIVHTKDGDFLFYYRGKLVATLYPSVITEEPFCNYPIYEGGN